MIWSNASLLEAHQHQRSASTSFPSQPERQRKVLVIDRELGAERIEIEANEFAAALVVPMPEYRTERRKVQ
jgi:hypothetical protein